MFCRLVKLNLGDDIQITVTVYCNPNDSQQQLQKWALEIARDRVNAQLALVEVR